MDISTSVGVKRSRSEDTRGLVNTMRARLGFSLAMSKDEFHAGGKGVRRTRNEGERDSANARGDGWPLGIGKNSRRGSTMASSCCCFGEG